MDRVLARLLALALVGFLAFPALSAAQITRGAVSGTVRDATGAVVPGASVTVTNMDTNISRSAVTDAQGFFRVPALEPGRYAVKAELSGFSTVEFKDVRLVSASEVTINPELKVAGVGEALTVVGRAEAIELNKTSGTIGTTTLARAVVELPLSADRNINNLIATAPNVSRVTGQGTFAANGQRSRNNNYMIDGSDNNDVSVTIATTQVVPESVAEFQVQTNAYSVEFGRNSGAQVNVITKSGTNTFRGEIWDYFRTNSLASLTNLEKDSEPHEARGLHAPPGRRSASAGRSSRTGPSSSPSTSTTATTPRPRRAGRCGSPPRAGSPPSPGCPCGPASRPRAARRFSIASRSSTTSTRQNPSFRNLTNDARQRGADRDRADQRRHRQPPSTYHTFMGRIDHHLTDSDNLTLRYYYNKRKDENAISNCAFGATFCGNQDLKDTEPGPQPHPHLRAERRQRVPLLVGPARPALPRERPDEPHRRDQRPVHGRRSQQLPPEPRHRLLPVLQQPDLDEEPPHAEVRGGRPLQQGLQPVGLQLEGELHVQQPAGLHEQHAPSSSHAGPADGELGREAVADVLLRAGRLPRHPGPDPEPRPALRALRRPARPLRGHRRGEPGRSSCRRPPTRTRTTGRLASASAGRPRSSNSHPRRRQDRLPWRLRDGLRRDLLQPAHRERLELPAHRHREHQQRARHLPEPPAGRRQPRVQPAQRVDELGGRHREPRLEVLELLRSAGRSASSSPRSATPAAAAGTASTRSTPTPRSSPPSRRRSWRRRRTRTPSRACRRGACTRSTASAP